VCHRPDLCEVERRPLPIALDSRYHLSTYHHRRHHCRGSVGSRRLLSVPSLSLALQESLVLHEQSGSSDIGVDFLQCPPIAMNWDPTVVGSCIPPASLRFSAFFNSGRSSASDVACGCASAHMSPRYQRLHGSLPRPASYPHDLEAAACA